MLKKNLTPLYVGEKISNSREVWERILPIQTKSVKSPIPHSPTNVQWYGHVNHLGGEGRNGFDTFVRNVIYQQNGWRAFTMCWFSRLKFCISVCGIFFLNHSAPPSKGVWCGRLLGMWRFLSFFFGLEFMLLLAFIISIETEASLLVLAKSIIYYFVWATPN